MDHTTCAPAPVPSQSATTSPGRMPYPALIAMVLLSFLLVTAQFLPNGVLTEMAAGLGVTPGQAGQAVTVTAFVGLLAAPTVGLLLPRLDRRTRLLLDAERTQYAGWWPHPVRVLAPGGVLAVDNALSHAEEVAPLRTLLEDDARCAGVSVHPVGKGQLLATRRR